MTSAMIRGSIRLNQRVWSCVAGPCSQEYSRYSRLNALSAHSLALPLMRFLSVETKNSSGEFQTKFNSLKADALTKQRVYLNGVKELIELGSNQDLRSDHSVFLLICCGKLTLDQPKNVRLQIVEDLWSKIANPSLEECRALLQVYTENDIEVNDYKAILAKLKLSDVAVIYEDVLFALAEHGNVIEALALSAEMKQKKFHYTERYFNAMIRCQSRAKNLGGCIAVLELMSANNLEPNAGTFTELIMAHIENNKLTPAKKMFEEKATLLSNEQLVSILHTTAVHVDEKSFLGTMVRRLPTAIQENICIAPEVRNLCTSLMISGKLDKALDLLDALPPINQQNIENEDEYGSFFIRDVLQNGNNEDDIVSVCNHLRAKNPRALYVATELALRMGSSLGESLLCRLADSQYEVRPHMFWPILLNSFNSGGEAEMLRIVQLMVRLKCLPDEDTLCDYILPRLSVTLRHPNRAIKIMTDHGLTANVALISGLVSLLIKQNRIIEANKLLSTNPGRVNSERVLQSLLIVCTSSRSPTPEQVAQIIKLLTDRRTSDTYDCAGHLVMELIASPRMRHNFTTIAQLVENFIAQDIRISPIAHEILVQHFTRCPNKAINDKVRPLLRRLIDSKLELREMSGTHINHPRDMSVDELECHLIELDAKKMNSRGVLRRLMQASVREGRLERAVELLKRCRENKVDLSPGMMASVFELHVRKGSVDAAENEWKMMRRQWPAFVIDEHKIVDYASALVACGRLKDAQKALEQRAAQSKIRTPAAISKNVWSLLNTMALHPDTAPGTTLEMFESLRTLGYCEPQNNVLGPLVRESLEHGNLQAAVDTFNMVATKFRRTPLQLELMTVLVRKGEQAMLESVVSAAANIHGIPNTNAALAIAFADGGTETQLRRLLIDPERQVGVQALKMHSEYLAENGRIDALLKLAKAARGLQHVVNERDLYTFLIRHYERTNDYSTAVDLFERVVADDDLKVSAEFTRGLVNLLERNNLEIPTAVQLYTRSSSS